MVTSQVETVPLKAQFHSKNDDPLTAQSTSLAMTPLTPMPITSVTEEDRMIQHIHRCVSTITGDARYGVCLLALYCLSMVILLEVAIRIFSQAIDENISHKHSAGGSFQHWSVMHWSKPTRNEQLFHYATLCTLVSMASVTIDFVMSSTYWRRTGGAVIELESSREFSRIYLVLVVGIPNTFIFAQILSTQSIDFIIFCQYVCIYFVVLFRILSITATQRSISLTSMRSLFLFSISLTAFAFLYKLSILGFMPGSEIFKTVYTALMFFLHVAALYTVINSLRILSHMTRRLRSHVFLDSSVSSVSLIMAMVVYAAVVVAHFAFYHHNLIFFPVDPSYNALLEWIFCGQLIIWTAVRNFEVRKSEIDTTNQLRNNRKMTRSISHEIRTPLNTAFMALDLLIANLNCNSHDDNPKRDTAELLEIAESVKEGCDVALNILNQLLTFEKLSAGMLQVESRLISINELLVGSMRLFKLQAQQAGIAFSLDSGNVDVDCLCLFVDDGKMNQVLRNLLSNAMKFTPREGNVEVRLKWMSAAERNEQLGAFLDISPAGQLDSSISSHLHNSARRKPTGAFLKSLSVPNSHLAGGISSNSFSGNDGQSFSSRFPVPVHSHMSGARSYGTILISVVDSGPGVSLDDQRKLFQEYVQINPGELQKGQGTGLGLSISKSIVQLHGGNIGMYSEGKGRGSIFFIELPVYMRYGDSTVLRPDGVSDDININHISNLSQSNMSRASGRGVFSKSPKPLGFFSSFFSSDGASAVSGPDGSNLPKTSFADIQNSVSNIEKEEMDDDEALADSVEAGVAVSSSPPMQVLSEHQRIHSNSQQNHHYYNVHSNTPSDTPVPSSSNAFAPRTASLFVTPGNKITPYHVASGSPKSADGRRHLSPSVSREHDDDFSPAMAIGSIPEIGAVTQSAPGHGLASHSARNVVSAGKSHHRLGGGGTAVPSRKLLVTACPSPTISQKRQFAAMSLRILIVDDSAPNRKILAKLLMQENHTVAEAENGSVAVECVRRSIHVSDSAAAGPFDLILMDYYMPVMNGPPAIAAIRNLGFTGTIVGVSGVMDDDVNDFITSGANVVLCKPISLDMLWKSLSASEFF